MNANKTLSKYLANTLHVNLTTGEGDELSWNDGIAGVVKVIRGEETFAMRSDLFESVFNEEDVADMVTVGAVAADLAQVLVRHNNTSNKCVMVNLAALAGLDGEKTETLIEMSSTARVTAENRDLKRKLSAATLALSEHVIEDQVASMLTDKVRNLLETKKEAVAARKFVTKKLDASGGVPTLVISDCHFDEVVAPEEVEWMNEYTREIAMRRLDHVFDRGVDLLFNHTAGVSYDEMVVALAGDMVSGDIHAELARTNEHYMPDTVMDFSLAIAKNLKAIAKEFPSVYVPCVVGNHGRLTMKPSAKGKVANNFDYLMYRTIEALTADVPNLLFDISPSADLEYKVYNWTYRLTHGDQFKGGGGVGGIFPSLLRTDMRKHKRNATLRRDGYQYLVMGHFHRYSQMDGIIVNGTLKGVDEYSYTSNFDVQPACQALWLTHPGYGITLSMPVFADPVDASVAMNAPPVTPSMGLRKKIQEKVSIAEATRQAKAKKAA